MTNIDKRFLRVWIIIEMIIFASRTDWGLRFERIVRKYMMRRTHHKSWPAWQTWRTRQAWVTLLSLLTSVSLITFITLRGTHREETVTCYQRDEHEASQDRNQSHWQTTARNVNVNLPQCRLGTQALGKTQHNINDTCFCSLLLLFVS